MNIDGLPKELIKQLNLYSDVDKKIAKLFKGEMSLNDLLVNYYKVYGKIATRQYMMTTCYRMKKKGFLKSCKGKGCYELTKRAEILQEDGND